MDNAHKIPVYANLPRQLKIYDNESGYWDSITDESVIAKTKYIAVSYRQSDFPDKEKLEELVQGVCFNYQLRAYWLDFACTGSSQEEKNQDLYRIADVFRLAYKTLILIEGMDNKPRSKGWLSWGGRKWTLPEALLSKTFICKVGKREPVAMGLHEVANHAYREDDDERTLIFLYGSDGKDFLADYERVELLCKAVRSRSSGPDVSTNQAGGIFTAYTAEWVYALMGFFLHRIQPTPEKTEKEAFMELLGKNGFECDESRWEKFRQSDGKKKIGIRIRGSRASDHINDADLPKYVAAAKFDYGQAIRHACDIGTRRETLAEINRWLRSGHDKTRIDNNVIEHVLWLHGFAGSGKSTIAQTAAENWYREKVLGATFFCSQGITECTNIHNIIPTIAYQLSQVNEDFKKRLSEAFKRNKDLQHAQVHIQLEYLIIEPLRAVKEFTSYAVVIDALDELDDKQSISIVLKALDKHILNLSPLKFFITSRPEDHIYKAFRTLSLSRDTKDYNLNNVREDEADKDIRAFFEPRLKTIGYNMPQPWPSSATLDQLIRKARGLFIFASTAVKFLEDRKLNDLNSQLQVLLRDTAPTSNTPYAYLDQLYLQVLNTAFPMQDKSPTNILQIIFALLILGQTPFSVNKLQQLMSLPQGTIRDTLQHLRSLLAIADNDDEDIRLIHPSLHDFVTDERRCADSRFVVNEAAGHSIIVQYCLKRLKKISSEDMLMKSYMIDPSKKKWSELTRNLRHGNYADFTYAYKFWIFHIHRSNGQLDESALRLLEELVSKHRLLNVLVKDVDAAILVFLNLFNKFSQQPSPPPVLMKLLYEAVLFLWGIKWPIHMQDDKIFAIRKAKAIIQTQLSYKHDLYDLDPTFLLLSIIILKLAEFLPTYDIPEFENNTRELRNCAKGVHEMIMQLAVPENERLRSQLQKCMSTLYKELELSYRTMPSLASDWKQSSDRHVQMVFQDRIRSFNKFQTNVHRILGIPDNIDPSDSSELPNSAIISAPELNGPQMSVTISELYSKDEVDEAHTSLDDAAECMTTSVASSRASSPLPILTVVLSNESTSRDNEEEIELHEGTIAHNTPIDSPVSSQNDFTANQASNVSLISRNTASTNDCNLVVEQARSTTALRSSSNDRRGLSHAHATAEEEAVRGGFIENFCKTFCICCRSVE